MDGWGWLGGRVVLLWLVGLAIVLAPVFWLLARAAFRRRGDDSEAVLRRRYGRGELDRERYERDLRTRDHR